MALMGFGDFNDMFGRVDRMMNNVMRNMFNPMADPFGMMDSMLMPGLAGRFTDLTSFPDMSAMTGIPTMHGGSYVSVRTITTDGSGRPQVYEATQSHRYGPDGVKETQETVRDSASGLQKMAIGHHIHDRGHVMEKSKNWYTGEEEEKDEYINLDEEEGTTFEDEWRNKMGAAYVTGRAGAGQYPGNYRSLPSNQHSHQQQGMAPLALMGPSSSDSIHPQQQQQHHHHQHHHHHHQQHQHARCDASSSSSSRSDPDIEIISPPPPARHHHHHQQSSHPSAPPQSSRSRVPSKHRSRKDKRPYKRHHRNDDQQ